MIVYVESNFVLEMAWGQEQSRQAEAILGRAEHGEVELVFPGFALSEPFATLSNRERERRRFLSSLSEMVRQLRRSWPHQQAVTQLDAVPGILSTVTQTESQRLHDVIRKLLDIGSYIQLTGTIFREAEAYQTRYDLSPQDSIIYALIVAHLRTSAPTERKCFVSRN